MRSKCCGRIGEINWDTGTPPKEDLHEKFKPKEDIIK
jgi:hypothetical protein